MLIYPYKKNLCEPLIIIVLLYVLPVLIFRIYDFLFDFRFAIFGGLWFLAIIYAALRKHGWEQLGFSNTNLKNSLKENGVFTIGSIPILLVLHFFIKPNVAYRTLVGGLDLAIIYILLCAPLQEFIFRDLLLQNLKS